MYALYNGNDLCPSGTGAKYGTGRRSSKLAQFFCAVRDDTIPETEEPRYALFKGLYMNCSKYYVL